jgi:hypothetical protein
VGAICRELQVIKFANKKIGIDHVSQGNGAALAGIAPDDPLPSNAAADNAALNGPVPVGAAQNDPVPNGGAPDDMPTDGHMPNLPDWRIPQEDA